MRFCVCVFVVTAQQSWETDNRDIPDQDFPQHEILALDICDHLWMLWYVGVLLPGLTQVALQLVIAANRLSQA